MGFPTRKGQIKCVIYDCDGVLFDSIEANTRFYNDLCLSAGRAPLKQEEMGYVHSHTVFEAIHFLFGREDGMEEKAIALLKQAELRKYIGYLKMEPHLLETLELLRDRGLTRAINTNRTTTMKYILERFGLSPFFEMVVTALDVKNPKPHPESVEKILAALHLMKEEAVFVGDSEVDQQAARSAGIRFIAYKNRTLQGDAHIGDHRDLLTFFP